MTTVASAETLVTEFQLRGIHAYRSDGATEHACHATINKVEVQVHFSTDPMHGDIAWQGNDGRTIRKNRNVETVALADDVIDSIVNPA
jgi:hypothetical protein